MGRQIIVYFVGHRSADSARGLRERVPPMYRCRATRSDFWDAYAVALSNNTHRSCGKASGETGHVERRFGTLQARLSRLVRRTYSFSKHAENHLDAIHLFITTTTLPFNGKQRQGNHYLLVDLILSVERPPCGETSSFVIPMSTSAGKVKEQAGGRSGSHHAVAPVANRAFGQRGLSSHVDRLSLSHDLPGAHAHTAHVADLDLQCGVPATQGQRGMDGTTHHRVEQGCQHTAMHATDGVVMELSRLQAHGYLPLLNASKLDAQQCHDGWRRQAARLNGAQALKPGELHASTRQFARIAPSKGALASISRIQRRRERSRGLHRNERLALSLFLSSQELITHGFEHLSEERIVVLSTGQHDRDDQSRHLKMNKAGTTTI